MPDWYCELHQERADVRLADDCAGSTILLYLEFPLPRPTVYYDLSFLQGLYPIGSCMAIKEPGIRLSHHSGLPEVYVGMMSDMQLLSDDVAVQWPSAREVVSQAYSHSNSAQDLGVPVIDKAVTAGLVSRYEQALVSWIPGRDDNCQRINH